MSWDVFVQDLPRSAKRITDIPDDFRPQPLGDRASIIERIRAEFPNVDFRDPSWGNLEADSFSIEFNLGEAKIVQSFAMHIRGNVVAVDAVAAILDRLGFRALDSGSGEFFSPEQAKESLKQWSKYRDEVVSSAT